VNEDRIPLRDALARTAVPLAALAAMAALAQREVDPVAAAESVYLTVLATAGLLAVAFLAPAPAWELGVGATLATTIVWALPPGPGRGAAMAMLLVGALAVAAARRGAKDFKDSKDLKDLKDSKDEGSRFSSLASLRSLESLLSFRSLLPLSLGLQVLLRGGELLFQTQASFRTLVILLVLPTVGALATTMLSRRHGSAALIAAGAVLLIAPGWNVAATLGMAALAAGDLIAGRFLPWTLKTSRVRSSLVFLAVGVSSLLAITALLASYPWLRAEPLRSVLALRIPTPGTSLLPPATAVVVDAAHPAWTAPVAERSVEAVVLESSLSNGAGLKTDTPVATVWLRGPNGKSASWIVRAGTETGEWAARRPDVAAEAVLESPPAWISYVAGDFFGQRYRSLWKVEGAGPFTTLSIERNPALPPEVSLDVHLLEIRE
jgi:hypothetical protein